MEDRFEKMLGKVFKSADVSEGDALAREIDEVLGEELSEDDLFFVAAAGNGPSFDKFTEFVKNRKN